MVVFHSQVSVNIAGTNFNIQFAPERDSVDSIATNLCTQHAATIGITQVGVPLSCNSCHWTLLLMSPNSTTITK